MSPRLLLRSDLLTTDQRRVLSGRPRAVPRPARRVRHPAPRLVEHDQYPRRALRPGCVELSLIDSRASSTSTPPKMSSRSGARSWIFASAKGRARTTTSSILTSSSTPRVFPASTRRPPSHPRQTRTAWCWTTCMSTRPLRADTGRASSGARGVEGRMSRYSTVNDSGPARVATEGALGGR